MARTGWIAAAVFLADRLSKALCAKLPAEGAVLIPGILRLRRAENTGMAFSLFSGHPRLLGVLSLVVIAGAVFFLRGKRMNGLTRAGLMMIVGGAAGNALDRLTQGYVTDMLEPLFVRFAVFNLADACLVIGCLLVLPEILRGGKDGGADLPEEKGSRNPSDERGTG